MIGGKIADGRTAEVYEYGDDKVVKLLKDGWGYDEGNYEYMINTLLIRVGVSLPLSHGLININGRYGVVFDRIKGPSILSLIKNDPENIKEYAFTFAKVHTSFANKVVEKLPSNKNVLKRGISKSEELTKEDKIKIIAYLNKLPDDNKVCHGDFHPGNIIVNDTDININYNEYVVIDWVNASKGDPCADAAKTYVIIKALPSPDGIIKEQFESMKKMLLINYLREYMKLRGVKFGDIEKWVLPVAAARLHDNVPGEKDELFKLIDRKINKI